MRAREMGRDVDAKVVHLRERAKLYSVQHLLALAMGRLHRE